MMHILSAEEIARLVLAEIGALEQHTKALNAVLRALSRTQQDAFWVIYKGNLLHIWKPEPPRDAWKWELCPSDGTYIVPESNKEITA